MLPALLNLTQSTSGQQNSPAESDVLAPDALASTLPEKLPRGGDFAQLFEQLSEVTRQEVTPERIETEVSDTPEAKGKPIEQDPPPDSAEAEGDVGIAKMDKGEPTVAPAKGMGAKASDKGIPAAAPNTADPDVKAAVDNAARTVPVDRTDSSSRPDAHALDQVAKKERPAPQVTGTRPSDEPAEARPQYKHSGSVDRPAGENGIAQMVRAAQTLPQDTIAAQQFGLQVSAAARDGKPATLKMPPTVSVTLPDQAKIDVAPRNLHPDAAIRSDTVNDISSVKAVPAPTPTADISAVRPLQQAPQHPAKGLASPSLVPGPLSEPVTLLQSVGEAPVEMIWETSRPQVSATALAVSRPETPIHVARQMAEALQRIPDKPVELTLNPEELGRVRMSITAAEAGITVNVLAERIETLELMRRHIDQLAQEFQNMGYENIAFSFGEGAQGTEDDGPGDHADNPNSAVSDQLADPSIITTSLAHGATGLDIRL